MSLVPSLLQAIVQLDGEALVMHAGDKPYVVAPNGQVDLATRGLTLDAVNGIVAQMLPSDVQRALDEFGAAQYELPTSPDFPGEHFTVVAARGGDDVWAEIRRRRVVEEEPLTADIFPSLVNVAAAMPPPAAAAAMPAAVAAAPPSPAAPATTSTESYTVSDAAPIETTDTSWSDVGDIYGNAASVPPPAHYDDTDDGLAMPESSQYWSAEEKAPAPVDDDVAFETREIEAEYFTQDVFPQPSSIDAVAPPIEASVVEEAPAVLEEMPALVDEQSTANAETPEASTAASEVATEPSSVDQPSIVAAEQPVEQVEHAPAVAEMHAVDAAPAIAEVPAVEEPPAEAEAAVAELPPVEATHEAIEEPIAAAAEAAPEADVTTVAHEAAAEIPTVAHEEAVEIPIIVEAVAVEDIPIVAEVAAVEPERFVAAIETTPSSVEEPIAEAIAPVAEEESVQVEAIASVAEEEAVAAAPIAQEEIVAVVEEEILVAEEPVVEAASTFEEIEVVDTPSLVEDVAPAEAEAPAEEPFVLTLVPPTFDEPAEEPAFEAVEIAAFGPTLDFDQPAPIEDQPAPVEEIISAEEPAAVEAIAAVDEPAAPIEEWAAYSAYAPAASIEEAETPDVDEAASVEEAPQPEEAEEAPVAAAASIAEEPPVVDQPPVLDEPPAFDDEPYFDEAPPLEDFEDFDELPDVLAEPPAFVPPPSLETPTMPPAFAAAATPRPAQQPGVVLPMARNPIRSDVPPPLGSQTYSGLDRLLRIAAARGASTLYLSSDARPSVRLDSEMQTIDGEPILSAYDVESLLLTLMPERSHEALRTGAATEWISDIEDVGRVRCMSFRDQRGPGGVFRLMAGRAVSTDQLGLSREIQALAMEPEGLVLVAGPRSSGKRTVMSSLVDFINRSRRDHVITIEREINVVHDRGTSFISQREVRGGNDEMHAAARAALREDPDVLVIEELKTGALMNVALEAAASGHLVIGGFSAHNATQAVDRIIDLYAPEYRRQIEMAISDHLRGIVVQVLLRKNGGGRLAARELLLNTPAVASVIAEGKTSQLPMAIEGGRRHGMVPLNDALVGFVQSGAVDPREAYRNASDRSGLLAVLKRQGIDTSFVERFA